MEFPDFCAESVFKGEVVKELGCEGEVLGFVLCFGGVYVARSALIDAGVEVTALCKGLDVFESFCLQPRIPLLSERKEVALFFRHRLRLRKVHHVFNSKVLHNATSDSALRLSELLRDITHALRTK